MSITLKTIDCENDLLGHWLSGTYSAMYEIYNDPSITEEAKRGIADNFMLQIRCALEKISVEPQQPR